MTTWEYRHIEKAYGTNRERTLEQWVTNLNALGEQGWEIVGDVNVFVDNKGSIYRNLPSVSVLLAERPKPDGD
jgi:hypothetical protein